MANNEWDRDRDRDRDRNRGWERGYDPEQRRHEPGARGEGGYEVRRATDYGRRAGWGGQGWGAEPGESGREAGGGMNLYGSPFERERYGAGAGMGSPYPGRGERDRERGDRERSEYRDRNPEPGAPEWGGQGFGGREGGWGGYGSYDRERGGTGLYDRDRGIRRGESYRESSEDYNAGRYSGGYGSYNTGSSTFGSGYGGERRRWNEGPAERNFTGRGPRNWKRSDDRIMEDINERLTHHPDVDASDIDVEVMNGEVTLTGKVDERRAKRLAEDIAESVSGVRDIHNEIKVSRGFFGAIGDALTGRSGDEEERDRDRRDFSSGTSSGISTSSTTPTPRQKPGELTGTKK